MMFGKHLFCDMIMMGMTHHTSDFSPNIKVEIIQNYTKKKKLLKQMGFMFEKTTFAIFFLLQKQVIYFHGICLINQKTTILMYSNLTSDLT